MKPLLVTWEIFFDSINQHLFHVLVRFSNEIHIARLGDNGLLFVKRFQDNLFRNNVIMSTMVITTPNTLVLKTQINTIPLLPLSLPPGQPQNKLPAQILLPLLLNVLCVCVYFVCGPNDYLNQKFEKARVLGNRRYKTGLASSLVCSNLLID